MKSELLRMYKSKLLGNKYFFTVCGYLTFSEIISTVQLLTWNVNLHRSYDVEV